MPPYLVLSCCIQHVFDQEAMPFRRVVGQYMCEVMMPIKMLNYIHLMV